MINPYLLDEFGFYDNSDYGGGYISKDIDHSTVAFVSSVCDMEDFHLPCVGIPQILITINRDGEDCKQYEFVATSFEHYRDVVLAFVNQIEPIVREENA
ncbi:hypothetical protein [Shewanella glacialipiscicola]|uniref:hypothetical protein n=1 Tax=Shewanella glacialipiscicola TaxID=614069 RepID=UPI003D7A23AD